jgi:hypothetical protein
MEEIVSVVVAGSRPEASPYNSGVGVPSPRKEAR